MTTATTADLVAASTAAGTAVLAFNVITLEHAEAIARGAEAASSGVILQVSENTVRFHGGNAAPVLAACAEVAAAASVPIALHLDHFTEPALIDAAIGMAQRFAFSSIMIDAAHLDFRDNVEQTARYAEAARQRGLWVEAELGEVGGKDGAHAPGVRTDPAEAADFARRTTVDALAVAVGSSHAMNTRDAAIDLELTARLAAAVPIPLVLHGGSGVSDERLRAAAQAGLRKLNVGTALNIAFTGAVRNELGMRPDAVDPRPYLAAGRDAIATTVTRLCHVVGGEARV